MVHTSLTTWTKFVRVFLNKNRKNQMYSEINPQVCGQIYIPQINRTSEEIHDALTFKTGHILWTAETAMLQEYSENKVNHNM